jgi:hypothetical protein
MFAAGWDNVVALFLVFVPLFGSCIFSCRAIEQPFSITRDNEVNFHYEVDLNLISRL